jgi:hypothetical protein
MSKSTQQAGKLENHNQRQPSNLNYSNYYNQMYDIGLHKHMVSISSHPDWQAPNQFSQYLHEEGKQANFILNYMIASNHIGNHHNIVSFTHTLHMHQIMNSNWQAF